MYQTPSAIVEFLDKLDKRLANIDDTPSRDSGSIEGNKSYLSVLVFSILTAFCHLCQVPAGLPDCLLYSFFVTDVIFVKHCCDSC